MTDGFVYFWNRGCVIRATPLRLEIKGGKLDWTVRVESREVMTPVRVSFWTAVFRGLAGLGYSRNVSMAIWTEGAEITVESADLWLDHPSIKSPKKEFFRPKEVSPLKGYITEKGTYFGSDPEEWYLFGKRQFVKNSAEMFKAANPDYDPSRSIRYLVPYVKPTNEEPKL